MRYRCNYWRNCHSDETQPVLCINRSRPANAFIQNWAYPERQYFTGIFACNKRRSIWNCQITCVIAAHSVFVNLRKRNVLFYLFAIVLYQKKERKKCVNWETELNGGSLYSSSTRQRVAASGYCRSSSDACFFTIKKPPNRVVFFFSSEPLYMTFIF